VKKIAYLFPGQGAQYAGMGKDFFQTYSISRDTFHEADEILKERLSDLIFNGPEETLTKTKNSQVAIFVNSAAILRALIQQLPDFRPTVCSGLSLGEYTALFASGRLGFRETLLLVRERARLMNDACDRIPGAMAAVLGLNAEQVASGVKGIEGLWVANYNCPGQTVISGTEEGVQKGADALKALGAKRVLPLVVHGAFHSGLMQAAQDGLIPFIDASPIRSSQVGLVMNVPGDYVVSVDEIRSNLASQVTQSVRWEQGVGAMEAKGIDLYLEIGCGKALSGMNRKIGVKGQTLSIDKIGDLDEAAEQGLITCSC
jgi:[acyl-carrier-protein] S-malonyltransferase